MSARSPREAERNFLRALQSAVSCVARDRINIVFRDTDIFGPHAFRLGREPSVRVHGSRRLRISLRLWCRIVLIDDPHAAYAVRVSDYLYGLEDEHGHEVLVYHWHPSGRGTHHDPHMKLGYGARVGFDGLSDTSLPTEKIPPHQFIRLCIELGAQPIRSDWDDVLQRGQAAFQPDPESPP